MTTQEIQAFNDYLDANIKNQTADASVTRAIVTQAFKTLMSYLNNSKVEKVAGKSLISDSEITRLASVTNQDISGKEDTGVAAQLVAAAIESLRGNNSADTFQTLRSSIATIIQGIDILEENQTDLNQALGLKLNKTDFDTFYLAYSTAIAQRLTAAQVQELIDANGSGEPGSGSETKQSILLKLEIPSISGTNTGDQDLSQINLNISSLQTSVANKVDKSGSKVLSDNNYTSAEKTKLNGLSQYTDALAIQAVAPQITEINTGISQIDGELTATNTALQAAQIELDETIAALNLAKEDLAATKAAVASGYNLFDALNPDYFDVDDDGKIIPINSGTPPPSAPIGAQNGRLYEFTHATYPNDLEYRMNGGTPEAYLSGQDIQLGNDAVTANTHESRVKSVAGVHGASSWAGNPAIDAAPVNSAYLDGFTPDAFIDGIVGGNPINSGGGRWESPENDAFNVTTPRRMPDGAEIAVYVTGEKDSEGRWLEAWQMGQVQAYELNAMAGIEFIGGELFVTRSNTKQAFATGLIQAGDHVVVKFIYSTNAANSGLQVSRIRDGVPTILQLPANASVYYLGLTNWVTYQVTEGSSVINQPQWKGLITV